MARSEPELQPEIVLKSRTIWSLGKFYFNKRDQQFDLGGWGMQEREFQREIVIKSSARRQVGALAFFKEPTI